ncbi:MAG: hypothetical protein AAGG48_29965 [Planctomycetota bacterium]
MQFAKAIAALLAVFLVGLAFGQRPTKQPEKTKLERLHEERVDSYSDLFTIASSRNRNTEEAYLHLMLAKIDAAELASERLPIARELLNTFRKHEDNSGIDLQESLLSRIRRIEAEILVEKLTAEAAKRVSRFFCSCKVTSSLRCTLLACRLNPGTKCERIPMEYFFHSRVTPVRNPLDFS